jgi:UDP:flavonoid glycosyltransferase YjiC (YdhE family)
MAAKKVLFISGSFGLGHATRDLALANELKKQNPEIEISWIASEPASNVLRDAGEKMLPEAKEWANENITAENSAQGPKLNLNKVLINIRDEWKHNVEVFKKVIGAQKFDLLIGDETYEIMVALKRNPSLKTMPFVMIYDFIGTGAMTKSPMDQFSAYYWNRFWSKDFHKPSPFVDIRIFLGELEDIQDTKFGFLLPRRRDWAIEKCKFVGHVLPFKPNEYRDKREARAKLGYGDEPLVICSIGGTAVGKEMLQLCAQSYPVVREKIPDLRMVLVCGPRLAPEYLSLEDRIEVKGYVPRLYEHFAASDLAVVQSGGATTIELTALKKPFLFFPLIEHFEQRVPVSFRLKRHKAGIFMDYSNTTPQVLADAIVRNLGKQPDYANISTDGAQKASELISQLL